MPKPVEAPPAPKGKVLTTGEFLDLIQRWVDEVWEPMGKGGKVVRVVHVDSQEKHTSLQLGDGARLFVEM